MIPIKPENIIIGKVLSPLGHRGQLKIEVLSTHPARFNVDARVFICGKEMAISGFTKRKGGGAISLEGIDSIEKAQNLSGALIEIPVTELKELPDGSYYHHDIIGLKVKTNGGETLGEIIKVLITGANDVYIIKGNSGEILIPAIKDVILSVDIEKREMIIEPIEGLI
jgi:16S rRNA processing protein RimM